MTYLDVKESLLSLKCEFPLSLFVELYKMVEVVEILAKRVKAEIFIPGQEEHPDLFINVFEEDDAYLKVVDFLDSYEIGWRSRR